MTLAVQLETLVQEEHGPGGFPEIEDEAWALMYLHTPQKIDSVFVNAAMKTCIKISGEISETDIKIFLEKYVK
jgi:hypothetical protein